MTRDEALISAALEMAARRINSDDMRWLSRCQVADAVRAIDVDEVLAKVGTVVTDGGSVAVCSICDIAGCHHIREAKAQPDHDAVAHLSDPAHMPRAWIDVMGERVRQITVEGWTPEHDDIHERAELAQAAACYALSGTPADEAVFIHGRWKDVRDLFWPWSREWWKPTTRRRDLVKSAAMILAEIERLDRDACKEARDALL